MSSHQLSPVHGQAAGVPGSSIRLGSPIHFRLVHEDAAPKAESHSKDDHRQSTMSSTESSFVSLHSTDFSFPIGKKGYQARSNIFDWPQHGPRSRILLERDDPTLLSRKPKGREPRLDESFMSIGSAGNSTTFDFPHYAPTISRMSIATDASSRYAPSMTAPSSVIRRTAAWANAGVVDGTVSRKARSPTDYTDGRMKWSGPLSTRSLIL